jgi:hypothetical protein
VELLRCIRANALAVLIGRANKLRSSQPPFVFKPAVPDGPGAGAQAFFEPLAEAAQPDFLSIGSGRKAA